MAVWQLTAYAKVGTTEFRTIIDALSAEDIKVFAMSIDEIKDLLCVRYIADDVNNRATECIFDKGLIAKPNKVVCVKVPDGFKDKAAALALLAGNGVCVDYSYSFFEPFEGSMYAILRPADIDLAELILKKSGFTVLEVSDLGQF